MEILKITLSLATLLCSLVAGFLFAFSIVVMKGIETLNDQSYLRAFKSMDRVIQDNQPIFILVWLGSIVVLAASALLSLWHLAGLDRVLVLAAFATYLIGVQLPTFAINVPLNNHLQAQDLDMMSESSLHETRARFEHRWTKWNYFRTVIAIMTSVLLIVVVHRF